MKTTHSSCWIAILVLLLTVGSSGTARSADFEFESKLVASDSAPNSAFGDSVSVEGGLALIGASNDGLSGAAYVYRFGTTDWVEEQKLVSSDLAQFDIFGRSVSLSGDVALVGADGDETLTGLFLDLGAPIAPNDMGSLPEELAQANRHANVTSLLDFVSI